MTKMATTQTHYDEQKKSEYDVDESTIESLKVLAERGKYTDEIARELLRLVD